MNNTKEKKLFPLSKKVELPVVLSLVITHGLWNLFVYFPQLDFVQDMAQ